MALVKVTDANGNETYVPERWLDHEELGKGFTRVKKTKKDTTPKSTTTTQEK